MNLQKYIKESLVSERLHIGNNTKSAARLRPTSKNELRSIIEKELEQQGPDADLNHIDVSEIDNMYELFHRINKKTSVGNIKIDQWDVNNVTDMESMFADCTKFNADLSNWDVSNVTSMQNMFIGCETFNSDLSKWDTSNVEYMGFMFAGCSKFNSDLSKWDVSNVISMYSMFTKAKEFECDLSKWDTSRVGKYKNIFYGCPKMADDLQPKFN